MKSIILGILSLYCYSVYAQKRVEINTLVPNVLVNATVDGVQKKIPLSSYRGKWVIIDFWGTTCSVCIKGFSHIDSLQQKFKDRLQFLVVTQDNTQKVQQLRSRVKFKFPAAPLVFSDKTLSRMFPYNSVPLHVWIDDKGYVRYITSSFNANEEVISAVLAGKKPNLSKQIQYTDYDRSASLLTEGNGRLQPHLKYYSCVMTHLNEIGYNFFQLKRDSLKNKVGIKIINQSLLSMYQFAAGKTYIPNEFSVQSRIIFETADSLSFIKPVEEKFWDDWDQKMTFCYESNLPIGSDPFNVLMNDLNNYFPYNAVVEKRKVLCNVLVRTSSVNKILADSTQLPDIKNLNSGGVDITNLPLSKSFIRFLSIQNENSRRPFIDETGFNGNSTLKIDVPLSYLEKVRTQLKAYDLDIREEIREIPMLVIRDKKK